DCPRNGPWSGANKVKRVERRRIASDLEGDGRLSSVRGLAPLHLVDGDTSERSGTDEMGTAYRRSNVDHSSGEVQDQPRSRPSLIGVGLVGVARKEWGVRILEEWSRSDWWIWTPKAGNRRSEWRERMGGP